MNIRTDEFWNEVKRAINKVSDEYDIKWRKRKRVIGSHFLILFIFKLFQSDFKIGKEVDFFFKHSPGILFCLLPAIASRPCFERGLKAPGFLGLLFSLGLVVLAVTHNN